MAHDIRHQLQHAIGSRYTLESELGGGGMSRVFLATERALGRRVVIKVLPPELVAGVSARRFAREIQLTAALQHANIVPILAAGESDVLPHYTMPFVDGRTLRADLEHRGALPIPETIAVLRDVARALAYAHDRGVVHRDIKPENILLSGGAAVVTDFGIAKALNAARETEADTGAAPTTSTQLGVALGTPAYMSPEQVAAEPTIDPRADLYALGCVAYEMITGAAPFAGRPAHRIIAAHLSETPATLPEHCPPRLRALVERCLEKDPAARPADAREVLRALDDATAPLSLAFRLRQPRTMAVAVAVAFGALALVLARLGVPGATDRTRTVAVVPFLNLSGDSTDEYLADGVADGLATALGKLSDVRIVSRSLAYRYKGRRDLDPRQIGESLSADHVLQGTVRRVGQRLRLSAVLTDVADNRELWSERYDRGATDAVVVQDEITRAIASALGHRLASGSSGSPARLTATASVDPQAYDLYLRGRFLLLRRGPGVRQAIEKLEQAITLDSAFAPAHAALALSLQLLPYFEPVNVHELEARTFAAVRRALALDSGNADAHTALALVHQHRYDWPKAEAAYRRAVANAADDADVHIQYGRFLFYVGRFEEAQAQFERAREVDPYSAVASAWVGHLLVLSGAPADGWREIQRALEIDSLNPPTLHMGVEALLELGRRGEARELADRMLRRVPTWRSSASWLLAQVGDTSAAREMLRDARSGRLSVAGGSFAPITAHLALGDTGGALDVLERATARREPWPTFYGLAEHAYDPLRGSARFDSIVRRVGLDPGAFTVPRRRGRP
jgi:serine/threonine-protein kinase